MTNSKSKMLTLHQEAEKFLKLEKDVNNILDKEEKAGVLLELGLIEAFRKSYSKSIKYIEDAQKIYIDLKDTAKIAVCLAELAIIYYQNSHDRLMRALTLLNDAKYLIEKLDEAEKQQIDAKILHYYGIIYFFEKRHSDALKYFNSAKKALNNSSLEYAKVLDSLAIFYLRAENHQIATEYMKESLSIKSKIGNIRELAVTELLYGRFLSNTENYEDAERHLIKGLNTIENLNDFYTAARIQSELAKIYLEMGDIENAEKFTNKSIETAESLNLDLVAAFSKCILAHIQIRKIKPEKAIQILDEIEPVFSNISSPRGYGFLMQIKSQAYLLMHQTKGALEALHEAVELFKEAEINPEIARSYYELGKIYKECLDFPMASSSLMEALNIAKSNRLFVLSKKIEDLLFEVDEAEWKKVVNKTANKEDVFSDGKSFLDTLAIIGDITRSGTSNRDPFLALLRIGRSIAAETDIDRLLTIITEETQKALSADRCTLFLLDKDRNELWSKVALGMGKQEIRFPANKGLAGHVVMTGETINIKEAYNDSRFNKEIDKKTGYTTKTILCMPMRNLNHEIVGVFQVLNKFGSEYFTTEDEDLLIAIGSSTGIAIENARLFKKQQAMYEDQKKSFDSFINTLALSIDARDKITAGHAKRVTEYSVAIAEQMQLSEEEVEVIEYAALLHDFGKIGVKDSVLCKEGKLTKEEYLLIQDHVKITYDLLKDMYFEEKLKNVPEIASSHHEKYDGSGYFRGLTGDNIPLGGRILAVADVFDAITSKRHYRERMPIQNALGIIRKDAGTHFDPQVVDKFFEISLEKVFQTLIDHDEYSASQDEIDLLRQHCFNDIFQIVSKEEQNRNNNENLLYETFNKFYNL
jgi:HD-GYP domain-containing protein (c-di-GMP phosphodiesterase class II)